MEKCCLPGCEEFTVRSHQERDRRKIQQGEAFCYPHSDALRAINLPSAFRYNPGELDALSKVLGLLGTEPLKAKRWKLRNPPCRKITPSRG